jgi:hypothetical protein
MIAIWELAISSVGFSSLDLIESDHETMVVDLDLIAFDRDRRRLWCDYVGFAHCRTPLAA